MRFVANENIPVAAVRALRDAGLDVVSISETAPGTPEQDVLGMANQMDGILVTFDKDFAELVFRESSRNVRGVILLRIRPSSPESVADFLLRLLTAGHQWEGFFSVAEEHRLRMVPLPREE